MKTSMKRLFAATVVLVPAIVAGASSARALPSHDFLADRRIYHKDGTNDYFQPNGGSNDLGKLGAAIAHQAVQDTKNAAKAVVDAVPVPVLPHNPSASGQGGEIAKGLTAPDGSSFQMPKLPTPADIVSGSPKIFPSIENSTGGTPIPSAGGQYPYGSIDDLDPNDFMERWGEGSGFDKPVEWPDILD